MSDTIARVNDPNTHPRPTRPECTVAPHHHWVKRVVGRRVHRECVHCHLQLVDPHDPHAVNEQPAPTTTGTFDTPAVQDLVIDDIRTRKQVGVERYGTPLLPHNGRDMLRDAYEEALDLCVYLRGAIAERDLEP